eukprot:SAG31_NODE_11318_length_1042_cov_1.935313_1_plen_175_part_00
MLDCLCLVGVLAEQKGMPSHYPTRHSCCGPFLAARVQRSPSGVSQPPGRPVLPAMPLSRAVACGEIPGQPILPTTRRTAVLPPAASPWPHSVPLSASTTRARAQSVNANFIKFKLVCTDGHGGYASRLWYRVARCAGRARAEAALGARALRTRYDTRIQNAISRSPDPAPLNIL